MQTETPPTTDTASIAALVAKLRSAFESGRTRPIEWRRRQLQRMKTMLVEHETDFLDALAADLGKPRLEGWATDIGAVINEVEYALRQLRSWTKPVRARMPLTQWPGRAAVHPEPYGVALVIAPWNYPIHLLLLPIVSAIAAGNAVVGKPSKVAARTSATLARLVPKYLDPESVAVVEGGVGETQALLAERFDYIFFTGNGRVGRIVMEAAAEHLTPVTLELGGKCPAIVDESANVEVAARRIAFGKFLNAGQTCVAPDYVLVARTREAEFVRQLGRAVRNFYGTDPAASPDYARIVNDAHFQRLERLLAGSTLAIGGETNAADRYIAPTVLRGVTPDAPIMTEEIFGPILPVLTINDVDDAIRFINGRDRPLAVYIFAESDDVQQRVLERTSSGGVCVNATVLHVGVPMLPFGGVGASGMGAYHGKAGFDTFSHRKSVLTKPTRIDPKFAYPPYTKIKERLIRRFL
jgi:aldehyde dehydrogenase (NAD+)